MSKKSERATLLRLAYTMTYLYAPVATSQIFTVLSQEAVANFLSSKEMSQSAIMLTCPLKCNQRYIL